MRIEQDQLDELMASLAFVEDPRVEKRSRHLLIDILVITICATLCGAETCTEIEIFAEQKEEWLRRFLALPNGIPSHDTFGRVLSLLDPLQVEAAFRHWVDIILGDKESPKRLSIDGKSVTGTARKFTTHPLHIVSVYSHELGLTLAQTEAKYRGSGEVEGSLECLKMLDIKDVTITADAALAVKRIIEQVREQKGHYIVPIKGNQRLSKEEIESRFGKRKAKQVRTEEKNRGRLEERICEVLPAEKMSNEFNEHWRDVKTLIRVTRKREAENLSIKDESKTKIREDVTLYISSRELSASEALKEIRSHWQIENGLHWTLDVAFGEDTWRTRAKSLARNLSLLRKIAMNIIRQSNTKGSVRGRIKKAGWNTGFLEQLMFGGQF
jgi:predicted transposase YbfD/YdcC